MKCTSAPSVSAHIGLYSIDCVRKLFRIYELARADIGELLNRARLAEASEDIRFWDKAYEVNQ